MEYIRIEFGENEDVELDEVDIGVADSVVAFDVSGRILGLDEDTISQLAGKRLVPTELRLEVHEPSAV